MPTMITTANENDVTTVASSDDVAVATGTSGVTGNSSSQPAAAPPVTPAPDNANVECVGPTSTTAGSASSCDGCPNQASCASGAYNTPEAIAKAQVEQQKLYQSLCNVSHIIMILSGKGGVGKSTMATQLALTLSHQNYAVGLLDVDLCGPSIPQMIFGKTLSQQQTVHQNSSGLWIPVYTPETNLAVMSINFLLSGNKDQAVIWRGPRKNALIQQFITQVDWTGGPSNDGLDYLIIDTPPGTSDEHISTVQYIQQAISATTAATATIAPTTNVTTLGAIVITTPEEASLADVRKELSFCIKTKLPIYGIIENMATMEISSMEQFQFRNTSTGIDCTESVLQLLKDKCPELFNNQYIITSDLFAIRQQSSQSVGSISATSATNNRGIVEEMAVAYACSYWGTVPLDRTLLQCCDDGNIMGCFAMQYPNHTAAQVILEFCDRIVRTCPVDMIDTDEK